MRKGGDDKINRHTKQRKGNKGNKVWANGECTDVVTF
jgi:hypothetical protein